MKHTYTIVGMTCNGCRSHVEKTLANIDGVTSASVDLEKAEATLEMDSELNLSTLQNAMKEDGGHYSIHELGGHHHEEVKPKKVENGNGTFYCPMHCEGDKTYTEPGDCPVCGMDLVEEASVSSHKGQEYTCPMHPEVVRDEPGDCPICGMDLVPKQADVSAEEKSYNIFP